MKTLSCLVIEDEPIASRIVASYIEKVDFLKLTAVCSNAVSAAALLKQEKIDVIFLDIHLPGLKGIDFLRSLERPPQVIVTSAYDRYALEGYELEITDYLLKPFAFTRFLKAVSRLRHNGTAAGPVKERTGEYRFFNVNKKMTRVYTSDILYVESLKEYVRIYLPGGSLVTKFQLGALEKFLDDPRFLRVHRSYLVTKDKITSFSYEHVQVDGKRIPVGRSYAGSLKKELAGLG